MIRDILHHDGMWIGLSDGVIEDNFVWDDGTPVSTNTTTCILSILCIVFTCYYDMSFLSHP